MSVKKVEDNGEYFNAKTEELTRDMIRFLESKSQN